MNLEKITNNYLVQDVEDRIYFASSPKQENREEKLEKIANTLAEKEFPKQGNENVEIQREIFKQGFYSAINTFLKGL